jgi:uncharacterized membrane protein
LSLKTKVEGFSSVWASKPMATVCEWFGLKTTRTFFASLSSKPAVTVSSGLASKPAVTISAGLSSKPTVTVCEWFELKTTWAIFAGLATKPAAMVSGGLASKPVATVSDSLASKPAATVSPGLASKLMVGFLVEPKNQGGRGFSGLGLKTGSSGLVICTSKSPRWFIGLDLKTKRASVCRLHRKIDVRGRRGTRVEI